MLYRLKHQGFLMLGPAETAGPQTHFTVVDKKWRLFRKAAAETALPAALSAEMYGARYPGPPPLVRPKSSVEGKSIQDEATRLILDRYSPPGVVVYADL